jgi:hypothetical protein
MTLPPRANAFPTAGFLCGVEGDPKDCPEEAVVQRRPAPQPGVPESDLPYRKQDWTRVSAIRYVLGIETTDGIVWP